MSFRHWDTFHRMRRFCAHTGTAARPLSQHDRSPCIRPPHSRVLAAIAARGQLRGQLLAADTHAFECWMGYALILLFATIDGRSSTSLLHTPPSHEGTGNVPAVTRASFSPRLLQELGTHVRSPYHCHVHAGVADERHPRKGGKPSLRDNT